MQHEFDQLSKESNKAYQAFRDYCDQGPSRSLQQTTQKIGRSLRLLKAWSAQHNWVERSKTYDSHLARVALESQEHSIREKAAEWTRRQEELRDREHAVAVIALDNCQRALAEKVDEGKLTDLVRVIEMASKLGRLATGLPAVHVEATEPEKDNMEAEFMAALDKVYGTPAISSLRV